MSVWIDKQGRRHASVMVGGERLHRILPKDATAREAKNLEAELRASLEINRAPRIPGNPLISEVMALYFKYADTLRSPLTAKYHAGRAEPWAKKYRVAETRAFASEMVEDMADEYSPATINRTIGCVKKALHIAWEKGITGVDYSKHLKRLPENNSRTTYLTIEQVQRLTSHASETVKAAIWIALLTGARRGEILAMQPGDVGKHSITIHAGNTKTLRTRTVPIVPAIRPYLKALPLPINFEGLKSGFRRAREASGMPQVRFHDLRHSCASLLINMGEQLSTVRDVLGHTSVKTTERYAHLNVSAQRKALGKLGSAVTLAITQGKKKRPNKTAVSLVGDAGFEPATPAV